MNKHVLYLFLFGLCLIGCSRDTLSHQKTDISTKKDSSYAGSAERKEEHVTTVGTSEQNSKDSNENRVVVKFDTDKPILPETGLPPIKEISFTGKTSSEKTVLNKAIQKKGNIKESRKDSANVHIQSKIEVDDKTEKKTNPYLVTFWRDISFIFLIVFLFWIVDLIIKKWPQIKLLWKRIRGL